MKVKQLILASSLSLTGLAVVSCKSDVVQPQSSNQNGITVNPDYIDTDTVKKPSKNSNVPEVLDRSKLISNVQ